jgi:hypothetical protein
MEGPMHFEVEVTAQPIAGPIFTAVHSAGAPVQYPTLWYAGRVAESMRETAQAHRVRGYQARVVKVDGDRREIVG